MSTQRSKRQDISTTAAAIEADISALVVRNTPALRAIRQKYSRALAQADPDFVSQLALRLCQRDDRRWLGYELLRHHRQAFARLGTSELEQLGRGLNSWWTVDAFARTLAGPAWLALQVSDRLILTWAHSPDRWWRRAALASTVTLNVRSQGGLGDARRTLRICRVLVKDRDDMVVKALSWALRELVVHDAAAVQAFLARYDAVLAARVKREVRTKLRTGLKNPRRRPAL